MNHRVLIWSAAATLVLACNGPKVESTGTVHTKNVTRTTSGANANLAKARVNEVVPLDSSKSPVQSRLGVKGKDGLVDTDKYTFKAGEPIAVTVRNAPRGSRIVLRWYDEKGKQIAQDSMMLESNNRNATLGWSGKKMKPGKYRVVSYWGEEIAGDHQFTVTE